MPARSGKGAGGAWISRREAGEQCRKEEAVNKIGGQRKVGFVCWMSSKDLISVSCGVLIGMSDFAFVQ